MFCFSVRPRFSSVRISVSIFDEISKNCKRKWLLLHEIHVKCTFMYCAFSDVL